MGPIGYPETLVNNYISALRNISEERMLFFYAAAKAFITQGPNMFVSLVNAKVHKLTNVTRWTSGYVWLIF
jgi:hypothetical protein